MTQHEIVALDAMGAVVFETQYTVPAHNHQDRHGRLVMRPARFGAVMGGMGGAGLSLIVPAFDPNALSPYFTVSSTLIGAFAIGLFVWAVSNDTFAKTYHNIKETPVKLKVDVPERNRQTHIQTIRGESTIQHVYSATKYLPSPTGENMPISGELVDAFKARVTGEKAETAINRDICLQMPEFYPNENKDTQKKLYGTFIECLKHNNYVDQRRSTLYWNANGERWLLED